MACVTVQPGYEKDVEDMFAAIGIKIVSVPSATVNPAFISINIEECGKLRAATVSDLRKIVSVGSSEPEYVKAGPLKARMYKEICTRREGGVVINVTTSNARSYHFSLNKDQARQAYEQLQKHFAQGSDSAVITSLVGSPQD